MTRAADPPVKPVKGNLAAGGKIAIGGAAMIGIIILVIAFALPAS